MRNIRVVITAGNPWICSDAVYEGCKMDYYVDNPEKLEGRPKQAIADYVEQNGFLVPRRFDSIEDARKSHKAVLFRCEYPEGYDGISGLVKSPRLSEIRARQTVSKSMVVQSANCR